MLISKSILRQVVIVMSGRYVFFLSLETTRHANPLGYFLPLFFLSSILFWDETHHQFQIRLMDRMQMMMKDRPRNTHPGGLRLLL